MLEALVWDKVKDILSNPEVVLQELRTQSEVGGTQRDIISLDKEIRTVERQVKEYPNQEKRLISLLKTGEFTQDYVLDEINRTKREREESLKRLEELKLAKNHLVNLENAEVKLSEFYIKVRQRIEQCSPGDKRLAFEALALRIEATKEKVEITGIIPVEITATQSSDPLLTTGQTSACLSGHAYDYSVPFFVSI
jgi:site-specific DNA recombinase